MNDDRGFQRPGDAALSSYPPAANAHVVSIKRRGLRRVVVVVDTDPTYPYYISVAREGDRWYEVGDHN
jgi:hypothetical protein